MALYEIKEDCRIANKNYIKWDVVSKEEVGWYFPTIMKPCEWNKEEVKKAEPIIEEVKEEEVVEEKKTAKKRQSKKK